MTAPRYTSRGQFANMLERRAKELDEIASRMVQATGETDEAVCEVGDAVNCLRAAVKFLRDPVQA